MVLIKIYLKTVQLTIEYEIDLLQFDGMIE